jgi:quercetin dioxygenase-like cupin family protein
MNLTPSGSVPTRRGSAESFTGTVWQDPIIEAPSPARIRASRVTFEPGARTAWHTHPLGQTLHVLSGAGRVQAWGGPIREITPGDTVWIPPGEKHWHGAGPTTAMVHIALQEALDGAHVAWLEKVSDEQYGAPRSRAKANSASICCVRFVTTCGGIVPVPGQGLPNVVRLGSSAASAGGPIRLAQRTSKRA